MYMSIPYHFQSYNYILSGISMSGDIATPRFSFNSLKHTKTISPALLVLGRNPISGKLQSIVQQYPIAIAKGLRILIYARNARARCTEDNAPEGSVLLT
jgi:hypothetical protein